jgi:uncharacterized membrane protein YdbT with pleckstrin-like domain
MNGVITEKNYPVESLWILKYMLNWLIVIFIICVFLLLRRDSDISNLVIYMIFGIYSLIYAALRKSNFHYTIDVKFLYLKQGILNKQQRSIPYGVIQNIVVKQDLLDRIFGLASLILENASLGAGSGQDVGRQQRTEMVGFKGNKVSIPGLKKQNAETLKEIVLQKMKENPIDDSQSGL